VRAHYGETALATTARGELVVVNRRESAFGAGWWLAGLERLVMDPFGKPVLWVGGDGSTRRYTKAGAGDVWGAPSLDRPNSIKPRTNGGWERILGGGVKVEFDSAGRHVAGGGRTCTARGSGGPAWSINTEYDPVYHQPVHVYGNTLHAGAAGARERAGGLASGINAYVYAGNDPG
jgi:hypothetical protein